MSHERPLLQEQKAFVSATKLESFCGFIVYNRVWYLSKRDLSSIYLAQKYHHILTSRIKTYLMPCFENNGIFYYLLGLLLILL